jgi:2',3'-cyclic-nucleotide 2'-phosphodiesterase (5'-nucleotidase family)
MQPRLAIRAAFIGLLLLSIQAAALHADTPRTIQFTILHTNDTHGHILPYSYPETFEPGSPLSRLKSRRNIGGAARRATLVKQIRKEPGRQVMLIDAGDWMDGTPFSTEYKGDADIAVKNAIGYDLACFGNHEFSNLLPQVRKMVSDAKFPILCANALVKETGQPLTTPYLIREVEGAKIAFFGLITESTRTYPGARNDLTIADAIATARKLVPELRRQADFVVAVTHIGVEEDRQLATAVDGIDVIVGGHSHTMLPQPLFLANVPVSPDSVNGTIIVQNFQWAGTLGRLNLTLRRSDEGRWTISRYDGRLLPILSRIPEDPEVSSVIKRYWEPIAGKYGEVIGEALDDFTSKGTDYAEYNLMADAMRATAGTEFDLQNLGGVRSPLVRGPITYADLVATDPFSNTIITFRITGSRLKTLLEKERPAVSGIRYVIEYGRLKEATIGGQPIEDSRAYFGSTNSYYAQFILRDITEKTDTGISRIGALVEYIRKQKTIKPAYDGRRIIRITD